MKTKKCQDCGETKKVDKFGVRQKGWLVAYCKDCVSKRSLKWREKNRERYNAYIRNYMKKKRQEMSVDNS